MVGFLRTETRRDCIMTTAMVGRAAPDFDLDRTTPPGSDRGRARLEDYRGRWLAVAFYPRDF
jgi:peroxiredoxin